MAAVTEAASLMRVLAEPGVPGESVKAAILRAARRAGLAASLGKRLWYGEARRIDADTMDQLRAAAARDARTLEEALETRELILRRLAACEAALGLHRADTGRAMDLAAGGPPCADDRPVARGRQ